MASKITRSDWPEWRITPSAQSGLRAGARNAVYARGGEAALVRRARPIPPSHDHVRLDSIDNHH
jgi:hypothetical protein